MKTSLKSKIGLILFGIFLSFVLLEGGMSAVGHGILTLQEYQNRRSNQRQGTYRIMCIGESTTAETPGIQSWPSHLGEILNQKSTDVNFSVINKGGSGITTKGNYF